MGGIHGRKPFFESNIRNHVRENRNADQLHGGKE